MYYNMEKKREKRNESILLNSMKVYVNLQYNYNNNNKIVRV